MGAPIINDPIILIIEPIYIAQLLFENSLIIDTPIKRIIKPIKIITIKYTIPPIAINNNATKLVTSLPP